MVAIPALRKATPLLGGAIRGEELGQQRLI